MGVSFILHIFFSFKLLASHWLSLTVNRENINTLSHWDEGFLHCTDKDLTISKVKPQTQKCPDTTLDVVECTQMKSFESQCRNSLYELEATYMLT